MRKRSRVVHTRITEEQYQKLVDEAERQGITVAHLIRRKITAKEGEFQGDKRPYTPKHGRRISKELREYILRRYLPIRQQSIQQLVSLIPQTVEPPKTKEQLVGRIMGDMLPLYADYLNTQIWIRQQIQKAIELKRAREEKQRRKEEREWQRIEKRLDEKADMVMKLASLLSGYLQAGMVMKLASLLPGYLQAGRGEKA